MHARDRQAAAAVALTLAVAAFALGAAPRWGACLAAALAAACALPYLRSSRQLEGGVRGSPLLVLLALAFAFTLAQLLPLPAALVELVSPARHELAVANAAALGESAPALLPLSLDWPATLVELAKLSGYLLFAYACIRLAAARSRGRELILSAIGAVAAAVAVTGLAHEAAGASALFGVYEPEQARPPVLSPLLNPNHLSAFMAFGTAIALGLGLAQTGARRSAWLAVALLCGGVSLLSPSRGGAAALVIGVVVTGALVLRQRRGRARDREPLPRSTVIGVSVVVLCAVLLVGVFTAGGVADELAATSGDELHQGRVAAWRSAGELIGDYFVTGVGRGAFVHAFPRVHESDVTFAYLENEYLQAAVDWGVPGAAALAAALVLLALAAARGRRPTPREAGALGGLTALAAQNTVDFNLELPGVALAAIAAVACLVPARLTRGRKSAPRRPLYARAGTLAATAAIIALAATPLGRDARADTDAADSVAAAERAFRRHPADYVAAGTLAQALFEARQGRAVKVANRALALNPSHSDLHRLAARMLLAAGHPDQALLEYALAFEHRRGTARALVEELVARFPELDRAALGLPLAAEAFSRVMPSVRAVNPELAVRYGRRLLESGRPDRDALLAVAHIEHRSGEPARALAAARRAHDLGADADSTIALARALAATGDSAGAIATVEQALDAAPQGEAGTELRLVLAELHIGAEHHAEARTVLTELAESVADRRTSIRVHQLLAGIERALGNDNQAEWHRRQVRELRERP